MGESTLSIESGSEDISVPRNSRPCTLKEKVARATRYPPLYVLLGAALGVAVGVALSRWSTESDAKDIALKWFGLIGDLFVRALKAIVLPLVFISVSLSIVDMMSIGRVSAVGSKSLIMFLITTLVASVIGVITLLAFQPLFTEGVVEKKEVTEVVLGCTQEGQYLSDTDGSVACSPMPVGANLEDPPGNMRFTFTDISGTLGKVQKGPEDGLSLSDTFYDGIFTKLVADNIVSSFAEGQFAAVIFFAIFFGSAIARHLSKRGKPIEASRLFAMLQEAEGTLVELIHWLINLTPLAVFSLITKALGTQDNLSETFSNVGYLILANLTGMALHMVVVHGFVLGTVLRRNPFSYLKHIFPAQAFAVACSSSAATLPVTMKCVEESEVVPASVYKFVLPLGATINMDGSAMYFPCACVWLAKLNGIEPTIANYILLIIIATIGSAGTAPVPTAALVLIITAYNTVFGGTGTPAGFEFIVGIDWLIDRFQTAVNVTGDCTVAAMVAKLVRDEEEREMDEKSDRVETVGGV